MQKPNMTVAGFFNLVWRSALAKVALSFIALLALLLVLLGGPPAGALAQDEPTATETLAAFDTETPTALDTPIEPTATEEPTLAADTATEEPTATETLAESETPTVDLSLTVTETPTITETPTETPTSAPSCEGLGVDELCAEAAQGPVRVIVELDMNYTPPAQLSAGAENAQEAAIQNNQNALEAEMNAAEAADPEIQVEEIGELNTIPFVSYVVDEAGLAELAASPLVESVHESQLTFANLDISVPLINADEAWDYGFTGDGQTIAIIDTGVRNTHEMFAGGKIVEEWCFSWDQPLDGVQSTCEGGIGEVEEDSGPGAAAPCPAFLDPDGVCFHGTHVAGIAAGNGPTFDGVAPDADIIAINVFTSLDSRWCSGGCVSAFDFEIIQALIKVSDLQGSIGPNGPIDIASVNMSLGGAALYSSACSGLAFNPMKMAIDDLRAKGIAVVIAAGNEGNTTKISYPACISSAISVGATTNTDTIAFYSNRAGFMSLYAPGGDATGGAGGITSSGIANDSSYVVASGTSMAAPHVAGAFAIMQEFAGGTMPVTDAINYLRTTGDPVTGSTIKRINVLRAFQAASVNTIAPTLLTIANNGYSPNDNTPTLTWGGVNPNAEDYEIQIDTTNTFVAPLSYSSTADFPGETVTTPVLADGSYFWRVRALNQYDAAGPWSTIFKFTVDTILPANVTLSLPAHLSTINTIVPKLTWMAATGAVKYQVQVSEDGTWTTIDLDHTTTTAVLFYQLTNAQALHTDLQHWRVRAIDIAGNPSALWTERTFTPLLLQSPTNGAFTTDQTPLLKWFAATGALQIEIQLDNNVDFTSPEVLPGPMAATLLQYQAPDLALGLQHWRMRIETAAGWSEWSPVWTFTVANPAPAITVLVSPVVNALTNDPTPDLDWNAVAGEDHYQLQIDNTMSMASPEQDHLNVPSDAFTPVIDLGQGAQYWRVRAIDEHSQPGPWSLVRKFTVDSLLPAQPVLMMPADGAPSAGNPNFTWTKAAEVVQSQVQIDIDHPACDFSSIEMFSPWVATTAFKPTTAQFAGTGTVCWRVVGKDAAGNPAFSTTTREVTITPILPLAPGPISPANASFLSDLQPDLMWNASAYSDQYHVQVAQVSTFTGPTLQEQTDPATTFSPATLGQGLWYWRVRGVHTTGTVFGPFSAVRTFTVDTNPPLAPTLSTPIDGAYSTGNPTFMWMAVSGANQYRVEIDTDDDDFNTVEYTFPWVPTTSFKPTPLQFSVLDEVDWRVRAKDAAGNEGLAASVERSLTIKRPLPAAPVLVNPPTGTLSQQEPLLDWNASANSVYYRVEYAMTANFTGPSVVDIDLGAGITDYQLPDGLVDGTYYWRVSGWNGNSPPEMGPFSLVRTFMLDNTDPLTAPTLNLPADAAAQVGNPTFTWTKPATATQTRLVIDEELGDFSSPLFASTWGTVVSLKPTTAQLNQPGGTVIQWRVESRDAAGNEGPPSAARSNTIKSPLPAVPVLQSPVTGYKTNVDDMFTFDWADAANAAQYEVQISRNVGFTDIAFSDVYPSSQVINEPFAFDEVMYWWRVRSVNSNSLSTTSAFSAVRTFTIDITPPPAPALSSPAPGATSVGNPTFMWMAVAGANQYKLEIDNTGDTFGSIEYDSGWLSTTSHKPSALLFSGLGSFEWRVFSRDAAGNPSASPSLFRTVNITVPVPPNVPTLLGPANNTFTNDDTPVFTWTSVPYGDHYEIWVDRQSGFTMPRDIAYIFPDGDGSLTYEVGVTQGSPNQLDDGLYYWWVWGYNSVDPYPGQHSAAWSAKFMFTVDTTDPAAPTLTGPASLSVARNTWPTFMWSAVAGPGTTQYRIEVDQVGDNYGSLIYDSGWITGTSHKPSGAPPFGAYEWRMLSRDAAGNPSPGYSATRTFFEVTEPLPVAPMLASPATNAMTTDNTPTLFWNTVAAADTYEIQIDNNSTFSSPEATGSGLVGLNFTSSLIPNGTYNWRVRALNSSADGLVEAGPWSLVRIIKIVP